MGVAVREEDVATFDHQLRGGQALAMVCRDHSMGPLCAIENRLAVTLKHDKLSKLTSRWDIVLAGQGASAPASVPRPLLHRQLELSLAPTWKGRSPGPRRPPNPRGHVRFLV